MKIRDEGLVRNKAVYVALALDTEGHKHVLGLWIEQTEDAKFWLKVMNDLKTRGLANILIAVVDGLKGFPEAIGAAFPETIVQTCIVHLIRNSLAFVSWKDRKQIMPDLKAIYRAENADAALDRLADFEAARGARYPAIGELAPGLGACDSAIRVPAGHPQDDLHDESGGEPEPGAAQDRQVQGQFSERRDGHEAALPGHPECRHPLAPAY